MRRAVTGISVGVMVLCILAFVGSLILIGFGGDYDKYGTVAIPGSGKVTLPAGEVDMFFVAYTPNSGGGGPITVPDLKFTLDYSDTYQDPVVKEDSGPATTVNTKEHIRVWKLTVKTAGSYTVTTDGDVGAFIDPQLSFGKGPHFPTFLPWIFGILFFVSIGGIVVGQKLDADADAADDDPKPAGSQPNQMYGSGTGLDPELQQLMAAEAADRATAASAAVTASTAVATPVSAPSTDTPEQSMARLQQLEQLQQLHAAGTLSDAEYDAARKRLGSS